MQLPQVEADELGQPVWSVTSVEVSRAYRKMSVLVHPDKNPGADAQQAFEALNQAHRKLRDRGELVRHVQMVSAHCCSRHSSLQCHIMVTHHICNRLILKRASTAGDNYMMHLP